MRIALSIALVALLPAVAVAQQPTTPAPAPTPVVVPPPVIPPTVDTSKAAAPAPAAVPTTVPASAPVETSAAPAGGSSIKPGMTVDQVEAAWGKPAVQRTVGSRTYLFYKNDCLKRCGTFDVVFFDGGQVVDAIVRASYHTYDGTSSSPPDRKPAFTKPGT